MNPSQQANRFPFLYHYPFNLVVTNTAATGTAPTLSINNTVTNTSQQGTNPVTLRLGTDDPFRWVFNMLSAVAPNVVGDASAWIALLLQDLSSNYWPFMSSPIIASLFAGNAKNPFPLLEPLVFGPNTQLVLTGYPIVYAGLILALGVGNGSTTAFSGTLNAPVLPGSVIVTIGSGGGAITATDNGNGVISNGGSTISGTINYTTGAIAIVAVTAPGAGVVVQVSYSQGCAQVATQFDLSGFYLKSLSPSAPTPIVNGQPMARRHRR